MFFFTTRQQARNFAKGRKVEDQGVDAPTKRWGVKVLKGF